MVQHVVTTFALLIDNAITDFGCNYLAFLDCIQLTMTGHRVAFVVTTLNEELQASG